MDLLCDNTMEGILLRLPLKYLHRLRAVSRRYNALVLDPGFAARYWRLQGPYLSGVFLQTEDLIRPWGHRPVFLTASGSHPSETGSVIASDLGFLPHLPQLHVGIGDPSRMVFILHSSAGLLLCSRGEQNQVHYYVCNPVTWQLVALPDLPWPGYYNGILSVAANGDGTIKSFQVVLVNQPRDWKTRGGTMCLDLKVFSSDTSQWQAKRLWAPSLDLNNLSLPLLGQSGTAYWIGYNRGKDRAIAHDSVRHSVQALLLPTRGAEYASNHCLGELQDGGLRYAHFDISVFEIWDLQKGGENGMLWKLVHRIGVMELAQKNPVATNFACDDRGVILEVLIRTNSLFTVIGLHPKEDIVFLDVGRTVATYSFKTGTISFQSPRQCFRMDVFPYVHPPHPVLIPEIKKSNLAHLETKIC
ncbi:unnamed protein product [Urochloa humidicola]